MKRKDSEKENISTNASSDSKSKYIDIGKLKIYRDVNNWYYLDKEFTKCSVIFIFRQKISPKRIFVIVNIPINDLLNQ